MTLVMAAVHNDNFAIMSCDSIIAEYYYNLLTMERLDDMQAKPLSTTKDKGKNKAIKLTDYVLMGLGGISDLAWDIQREMQARVHPDYDLKECLRVAETVMKDLRNSEGPKYREFLEVQDTGSVMLMSGFYKTGGTGFGVYVSGPDGGQFIEQKYNVNKETGYIYSMIPPVTDYNSYLHELFELPPGKPISIKNVADQMAIIQNAIYTNHPDKITSDMNTHVLFKPGNNSSKKSKKSKKGKAGGGKTPTYKYFEVETSEGNKADHKVIKIKKTPPAGGDIPKVQQSQDMYSREEFEYAVLCQAMVSDLGRLIMNMGAALTSLDEDRIFKAIGEYTGEVKRIEEKFNRIEPSERMKFYKKDFEHIMGLHVELSSLLYNSSITTGNLPVQEISIILKELGAAAEKVTVNTKNIS